MASKKSSKDTESKASESKQDEKASDDKNNVSAGANTDMHAEEPDTSTAGSGRNLGNVDTATNPNKGVFLKATDTLDVDKITADADESPVVVIKEDVWEEFYPMGSRRPSSRLVFTKGQVVPKATIEAMNKQREEAAKQADSDNDEDE